MTAEIFELPLDQITILPDLQSRASLNPDTVAQYAENMEAGIEYPPVVVFKEILRDTIRFLLASGFHREKATRIAKRKTIKAEVRDGTFDDALLFSVRQNADHGLPRTNADKRRAVQLLLSKQPVWLEKSDRDISEACNVSPPFVAKVLQELRQEQPDLFKRNGQRTFTHKNGKQSTMDVSGQRKAGAHRSGATAFKTGKLLKENPYNLETQDIEFQAWAEGWRKAEEESQPVYLKRFCSSCSHIDCSQEDQRVRDFCKFKKIKVSITDKACSEYLSWEDRKKELDAQAGKEADAEGRRKAEQDSIPDAGRIDNAKNHGRSGFLSGKSLQDNPFPNSAIPPWKFLSDAWAEGWREAEQENQSQATQAPDKTEQEDSSDTATSDDECLDISLDFTFNQGAGAAKENIDLSENPYDLAQDEAFHIAWKEGWLSVEKTSRQDRDETAVIPNEVLLELEQLRDEKEILSAQLQDLQQKLDQATKVIESNDSIARAQQQDIFDRDDSIRSLNDMLFDVRKVLRAWQGAIEEQKQRDKPNSRYHYAIKLFDELAAKVEP